MKKMMKSTLALLALGALVLALAGALVYAAGTSLSITVDDPVIGACDGDGNAQVTFDYSVLSTGAADAATVTAEVVGSGNPPETVGTIASGNVTNGGGWAFAGRNKTAEGSFDLTLAAGTFTVKVCVAQHGSQGNPDKVACKEVTFTVTCNEERCSTREFFGQTPHNFHLCSPNANIEIQFRGNFGSSANLKITGPNSFELGDSANREGESCNYHYNWDLGNEDTFVLGTYTIEVTGNGNTMSHSVDIDRECPGRP
jgi:hypothetical protein